MTQAISIKSSGPDTQALEAVLMHGDISKLSTDQRAQYVAKLCEVMGLSVLTQPFQFMTLQGKLVCYAGKNCAEQLRKVHNVSLKVTAREKIEDVYVVTVDATLPNGRTDSATGAVPLTGLKGDMLANAMMKAETKAKRRATLSICSLGMMDETEVETLTHSAPTGGTTQGVRPIQPEPEDGAIGAAVDRGYRIPFGKYQKRSLEEVGPDNLKSYIAYLEGSVAKTGKPLSDTALEFIERASDYIGALENEPLG